jgi:hypothetical protein
VELCITHIGVVKSHPENVACCSICIVDVPVMPEGLPPLPTPFDFPEVVMFQ